MHRDAKHPSRIQSPFSFSKVSNLNRQSPQELELKKICRFTRDERVTREEEEEVGEELLQRRVSKREGERKEEEEGRLRYKLSRSHAIPTYSSSTATE